MNAPVVAIALHDGYFSSATGAGRSNQALLTAVAHALASGVRLVLLPVDLHPTSPEYAPTAHRAVLDLLIVVPHQVTALDNGTAGQQRFGDLTAFEHLNRHAAEVINPLMRRHPQGLLIAIDQPFAGLGPLLETPPGWRLLYLPRSSADHHSDPKRAAWEQHGLDGWTSQGAAFGAISTHMRTLLTGKGIPPEQIIDVPGGLTAADRIPLTVAPPPPDQAESGFLLSMGRAQPYKGFDDLLDALGHLASTGVRLPHLLLAAVTDGPTTAYQHHLRRRVSALGLSATLWTRFDPGLPGLLHHPALRAVVVPSRSEPLGRIPLEAFAAGAGPVVATTAGGLAETVIDNATGYSAAPGDPRSLARAIGRALAAPPAEVARLRQAGKHLVAGRDYTSCITGALAALSPWAIGAAAAKP
ncbi:glycosyltransferase family 4 protein [Streptacidiphilus cavernicola]|uniref:D-inositol 3-phosphate glycosyltransferase n=1 Tax=Streptacidiphilus cavernicola TaxID=3342716 RepID=A0ABV6VR92_9ACTN